MRSSSRITDRRGVGLAALLLELRDQYGSVIREIGSQDLANTLGAHRETVASVLRAFRRQKLIDVHYGAITIRNVEHLAELADIG